jgi:hypothetical protein
MPQGVGTSDRQTLNIIFKPGIETTGIGNEFGQELLPVIQIILQEWVVEKFGVHIELNANANENNYYLHQY